MINTANIRDITLSRHYKWTLLLLLLNCINLKGQTTIPLDTIKDNKISINQDYKTMILNPDGWAHYANYYFSNDSLALFNMGISKFKKGGNLEYTIEGEELIGHAKYKLKDTEIGFFPGRELRGQKTIKFAWTYHKLIKINNSYFITESNIKNKRVRHVYIKK